jgi:hypothetical protein
MFGPSASPRLHIPAGSFGFAGERPSVTEGPGPWCGGASTVHNVPTTLFGPSAIRRNCTRNESSMLSLRNLPLVLIAALHEAMRVLMHDELMCALLLRESEIVCVGVATAHRRHFVAVAESAADRTAGRDALVAVASTSELSPRTRRTISGTAPFRCADHERIPGVSYDDI